MRDIKKIFHTKMGTIKEKWYGPNRSRRYQEKVARIYRRTTQKRSHDPDNHEGVVTHLEPDILECEVKWA